MKIKIFLLIAMLFASQAIFPCGNSYSHSDNTDVYRRGNSPDVFTFREGFNNASLLEELNKLADAVKSKLNLFEDENDRALTHMRMGEYDKAFDILSRLEKEKPNEYNIIANLGTLYELRGENEKALLYIKKAVALNSASHHGSEWFHIKVLEAKLSGKDNSWWITHSVLGLSTVQKDPEVIISDITYQLKERLPFTKRPDIMMASILNESGDYLLKHKKQQQAWVAYKIADEYDADNSFKLSSKTLKLEKYFSENNIPVPNYESHFIRADYMYERGKSLLETSIDNYLENQEELKEQKKLEKKKATIFWIMGGTGAAIVLFFVFYAWRKKKSE
ncbi:MAG TPA: tetratricopeptide repeat protein [Chitinophagaceae bacterium]|jgi:tetratricopeptide (TPR) repeat protein|nr:tetratricopeptide repeat protein [Chitinophagaceae bacterium]